MKRILISLLTLFGIATLLAFAFAYRLKEMPYIRLREATPTIDRSQVKLLGVRGWSRPVQYVYEISSAIAEAQIKSTPAVPLEDFYANSDYALEYSVKPFVSPFAALDWDEAKVYVFDAKDVPMCEVYIIVTPKTSVMMIYPR